MSNPQFSDAMRNAWLATYETTLGTSPKLQFRTGTKPANVAASATGTLLAEITCPSDWLGAPSAGVAVKAGTWTVLASATGVIGHYRFLTSGSTCHEQGSVSQAFSLTTSASTAANSNVLTFTSTAGVSNGLSVYGTGIPAGATVLAYTSTTVTLSAVSTAGVSSSVAILFGDTSGNLFVANTSVTASVTQVTVTTKTMTAPGA